MIIALWILNSLLALVFLMTGVMKLSRTRAAVIAGGLPFAEDFSDGQVKLIGAVEILGALGLILPLLTGIAPVLTPIAASGLVVVMIGAIVTHVRRQESALPSIVLGVLAATSAVLGFVVVLG